MSTHADYFELTKPRLTALVGVTVVAGSCLVGGMDHPWTVLAAAVGTALLGGGSSALNQAMEGEFDAKMERTRNRPVAAGRVRWIEATAFGAGLIALGFAVLALTNALTVALGAVSMITYVAIYTPMKRTTATCTLVGAIPGALPPVMGCTAVTNELTLPSLLLFTILFMWQLPHFLALCWILRDDYERGGFPMLSVIDPEGGLLSRQVALYSVALLTASLLPTVLGVAGVRYFAAALTLGVAFLALAFGLIRSRTHLDARRVFLASLVYLPALLVMLVTDRVMP